MEQHSIDSRLELVCLAAQLILENGGETYIKAVKSNVDTIVRELS